MKIAAIKHIRCGDYEGQRTLVWVPDEWTEGQFEAAILAAQNEYLAFIEKYDKEAQPPEGFTRNSYGRQRPDYALFPEKTVREIDIIWAARQEEFEIWKAEYDRARRTFSSYLADHGLKQLWAEDLELSYELDWGHRHALAIDYDETTSDDLPGPVTADQF